MSSSSTESDLAYEQFTVDCPGQSSALKMSVARYFDPAETNTDGVTLLFAHCIGSHKESWRSVIEEIFRNQREKDSKLRIREAYAFDRQNHSESAILNKEYLAGLKGCTPIGLWGEAVRAFVQTRLKARRIVAIGHSGGTACIASSTLGLPANAIPYLSSIFIEPMLLTNSQWLLTSDRRKELSEFVGGFIRRRKDTWESRQKAFEWMRGKDPWKDWDERVVRAFVDYALYQPDPSSEVVMLKTPKDQEAWCYPDIEGYIAGMKEYLRLSKTMPFHLIYGADGDLIDDAVKEEMVDASLGAHPASFDLIPNAGHLIPQEQPILLAHSICRAIDRTCAPHSTTRARL